jgi:hypothetical protein
MKKMRAPRFDINSEDTDFPYLMEWNFVYLLTTYVELKNPFESAVALNIGSVVIWGVDCRTLGALVMPFAVSLD